MADLKDWRREQVLDDIIMEWRFRNIDSSNDALDRRLRCLEEKLSGLSNWLG